MAMHNLAVVMAEQKEYAEAVKLFTAVLQLDPEHKTAIKYLTLAKQQLSKQKKYSVWPFYHLLAILNLMKSNEL